MKYTLVWHFPLTDVDKCTHLNILLYGWDGIGASGQGGQENTLYIVA
jgi:hypothetical protein